MPAELGDIFLEREFESVDPNGNPGVIKLRIGKPYRLVDTDDFANWRCPYQLIGIGSEKIREARGIDAIDAMLTSLQLADVWLKSYSRLKITWFDRSEYLGLTLLPPVELTDEEKAKIDPHNAFEDIFEEFFRNLKNKRKDSPE